MPIPDDLEEIWPGIFVRPDFLKHMRSLEVVADADGGTTKARLFWNPLTDFLSWVVPGVKPVVINKAVVGGCGVKVLRHPRILEWHPLGRPA